MISMVAYLLVTLMGVVALLVIGHAFDERD
jgi:hypothetical protein